ncbi:hypothetical protein HT031_001667 [Scenedesmus sp. PABB004]|nr:hypothetical protein HT031_001667 [Scenedesmus sp. PABB004]
MATTTAAAPAGGLRPRLGAPARGARLAGRRTAVRLCAHFPHHRVHLTPGGAPIPAPRAGGGAPLARLAPPPSAGCAPEQLVALLDASRWSAAHAGFLEALLAAARRAAAGLDAAAARAAALWAHCVACWPAWAASLAEDGEYVLEYALGVLPAAALAAHAALARAVAALVASPPAQRAAARAAAAGRALDAGTRRLCAAAGRATDAALCGLAELPPLQQLARLASAAVGRESAGGVARGLSHSVAALAVVQLAAPAAAAAAAAPRSRRARQAAAAATVQQQQSLNELATVAAGRSWAQRLHIAGLTGWARRGRRAAAPAKRQAAAVEQQPARGAGGVTVHRLVVQPLQQAGFVAVNGRGPTLAGVIAAASVLLAGCVYRGLRAQAEAAAERATEQVQLQLKAESLAAQRARFRRALSDSQAASAAPGAAGPAVAIGGGRRRGAASPAGAPDTDAWEDALPDAAAALLPAGAAPRPGGRGALPALDAAAAREYARFMAGARATDVPMWDSHMVDDLPKVSLTEMNRQTQMIRAAATDEERAAVEDTEARRVMVEAQLNSQLAQLSGAPLGRSAREAWRREQQEQQERAAQEAAAGGEEQEGGAARRGSPAGGARGDANPFAIPLDARAQWEADDHLYTDTKPRKAGGWGFGGGGERASARRAPAGQAAEPQQARRRRFADEHTEVAAAAPSGHGADGQAAGSSPAKPAATRSVFGSTLPPKAGAPAAAAAAAPAPAAAPPAQPSVPAEPAAAAAAAVGPPEGSPAWEANVRAEVLRSGAARRARRQQMAGQQAGSQGPSLPERRPLPAKGLQRPKWPGADAAGAVAAAVAALSAAPAPGGSEAPPPAGAPSGGGLAAQVSARDAQGVTAPAAAPRLADMQRLSEAAAASAEAAAEARAAAAPAGAAGEEEANPFAVDRATAVDDEAAFAQGRAVDEEAKRIRLEF